MGQRHAEFDQGPVQSRDQPGIGHRRPDQPVRVQRVPIGQPHRRRAAPVQLVVRPPGADQGVHHRAAEQVGQGVDGGLLDAFRGQAWVEHRVDQVVALAAVDGGQDAEDRRLHRQPALCRGRTQQRGSLSDVRGARQPRQLRPPQPTLEAVDHQAVFEQRHALARVAQHGERGPLVEVALGALDALHRIDAHARGRVRAAAVLLLGDGPLDPFGELRFAHRVLHEGAESQQHVRRVADRLGHAEVLVGVLLPPDLDGDRLAQGGDGRAVAGLPDRDGVGGELQVMAGGGRYRGEQPGVAGEQAFDGAAGEAGDGAFDARRRAVCRRDQPVATGQAA